MIFRPLTASTAMRTLHNPRYADALEADWNDKLRSLARAREERERGRAAAQATVDDAIRERLLAMTTDFKRLWADPATPNRERKRMLAHIIEDVTLMKYPEDGITKIHVRFKSGKTQTLITENPKSSPQQVKTSPKFVALVDALLDDHTYAEIAGLLNEQSLRPGGSARRGREDVRFTLWTVALSHATSMRPRGGLRKSGVHRTLTLFCRQPE